MRDKLKYLAAVLYVSTIGFSFIPIVSLPGMNLSIIDIMMSCLGFYRDSSETVRWLFSVIGIEPEFFAGCIVALLVTIFMEAVLTASLSGKKAYVTSLIGCFLDVLVLTAGVLIIQTATEEVRHTILYLLGVMPTISLIPVLLVATAYFLIFILSVVGICMRGSRKQTKYQDSKDDEMYLEQIRMLDDQQLLTEPVSWQSSARQSEPAEIQARPKIEERNLFTGAIIGGTGDYKGKVYPLEKMTEIFFEKKEGQMVITPYQSGTSLAGIYYIGEYGEYCVEPLEKGCFYLESGQPLGKGRKYYLPRGTNVYLKEKENKYTLA